MDLESAIRSRRMVRNFTDWPLDADEIDELCDLARRAPSAGNTQAVSFVVLLGDEEVSRYWDITLPGERRETFTWPGLVKAPALVVVAVEPGRYLRRYREPDKARSGLGGSVESWDVPFWWVDAGAVVQNLLLSATARGLGACLFGLFDHEAAVREALDVPSDHRLVGTVALGHPDRDRPGRSSDRPRRPTAEVVHRGRFGSAEVTSS